MDVYSLTHINGVDIHYICCRILDLVFPIQDLLPIASVKNFFLVCVLHRPLLIVHCLASSIFVNSIGPAIALAHMVHMDCKQELQHGPKQCWSPQDWQGAQQYFQVCDRERTTTSRNRRNTNQIKTNRYATIVVNPVTHSYLC